MALTIWFHIDLPGCQPMLLKGFKSNHIADLKAQIKSENSDVIDCPSESLHLEISRVGSMEPLTLNEDLLKKSENFINLIEEYKIDEYHPIFVRLSSKYNTTQLLK